MKTNFTPMESKRSEYYMNYFNHKNPDLAPTKGQIRFFRTMKYYYEFGSEYKEPAATREKMSIMLDEMNSLIKQGKVAKKNNSRQVKPATDRRSDIITDRQMKAIGKLAAQLGRTIVTPINKVEAFYLIKQLREELAAKQIETTSVQETKQPVTKQVAATKCEPEKKYSLIRKILNKLFKRLV